MSNPAFAPRTDLPWSFIRDQYSSGVSCYQLAEMYNAPRMTIYARAKREGWPKPKNLLVKKPGPRSYFNPDEFSRRLVERNIRRALKNVDRMSEKQLMRSLPHLRHLTDVCIRFFNWHEVQSTRARSNGKRAGRAARAPSPDYAHEDGSLDSESGSLL